MVRDNPPSIADPSVPTRPTSVRVAVFGLAAAIGAAAAVWYGLIGLTLSHYDARAHLVVARRMVDSLTPGWKQIGAVWLPLPHVLDLPAVLWDWSYRTGALPTALSVLALAAGLALLAGVIARHTGSAVAAIGGPAVILLNPNVLYLQSTPMTEPLLIGLAFAALAAVDAWTRHPTPRARMLAGAAIAALALTRYEGWCIAAALIVFGAWARRDDGWRRALSLAPWFAGAIGGFLLLSWGATGRWFVTSGFFVPDNPSLHRPFAAVLQVTEGTTALAGPVVLAIAAAGLVVVAIAGVRSPRQWLMLAPLAAMALPSFAFFQGHPYRVRYMVPLVAAAGVLAAMAIGRLPRRWQLGAAILLVAGAVVTRPPLDPTAPMVVEAQWETPFRVGREAVTQYLTTAYDGTPILASMGSLGHYMQEAAVSGFPLSSFLHEGNGDLFKAAFAAPKRYVRWVLIEDRAEGGDMLAERARQDPAFLEGFDRVAEGGGTVLYRRR